MCRSLSLRAQASRAILLLSLCNETRRGLNQGKFSWICHSEPFDFAQDKLRRGISNSRSGRQEKTIVIPQQRETFARHDKRYPPCSLASSPQISFSRSVIFLGTLI